MYAVEMFPHFQRKQTILSAVLPLCSHFWNYFLRPDWFRFPVYLNPASPSLVLFPLCTSSCDSSSTARCVRLFYLWLCLILILFAWSLTATVNDLLPPPRLNRLFYGLSACFFSLARVSTLHPYQYNLTNSDPARQDANGCTLAYQGEQLTELQHDLSSLESNRCLTNCRLCQCRHKLLCLGLTPRRTR